LAINTKVLLCLHDYQATALRPAETTTWGQGTQHAVQGREEAAHVVWVN
jgi:hypothetical protein